MKRLLLIAAALALACPVRAGQDDLAGRLKWFKASVPEALRGPMTGEMRAKHVSALKAWRALAACCSSRPEPSRKAVK